MAASLRRHTNPSKPNLSTSKDHKTTLINSIQLLLPELKQEAPKFSHFIDIFNELLQSEIDPPLETIWVYAALWFKTRVITKEEPLPRLLLVKDLFKLLSGCSGACGSSKCVALLASVVFELYKLVLSFSRNDMNDKGVKKEVWEIRSLIGLVVGYVSVCCCRGLTEARGESLVVSLANLVGVWIDGDTDDVLHSFFPLISGDLCREICVEEGLSVDYLAGIVLTEVVLLKLFVDLKVGDRGVELQKEMRSWLVASVTGIQSFYFFGGLLQMLLEPTLPLTSLLSSEDQIILKKALYDAVTTIDYQFLRLERVVHLPEELVRSVAFKRLIIAQEAIEFFRVNGDRKTAISYASAFSNSQLSSILIKLVTSQIGMEEEASKLKGSSPKALIKWLLNLEGRGVRLFNDSITKTRAKLALDNAKFEYEPPVEAKRDTNPLFYIDKMGEDSDENNDSMTAAFVAAAHSMRSSENGGRKRKGTASIEKKKRVKVLEHETSHDSSDSDREEPESVNDHGSDSESEVENPTSDEDV